MLIALNIAALVALAPTQDAPRTNESRRFVVLSHGDGPGRLDKDGDGFVSREEFSAPMGDAFAGLDKDADGRLSEDELKAGAPGERPLILSRGERGLGGLHHFELEAGGPGEHDVFVIRTPDDGGDGRERVIVRTLRGGGEFEAGELRVRRFDRGDMDGDGDGRVTRDEFIAPLAETFSRLDKDGSGALEAQEREAP